MTLATFPRPLGGRVEVEVVEHQAGPLLEVAAIRFGARHAIGFHLEELGDLLEAIEAAMVGRDRSRARVTPRLRSNCRGRL